MADAGKVPAATPTRTGNLELSVGRRRVSLTVTVPTVPVPPVRMLPLFQQIADKVMSMAVEQAAAAGHSVSCRKGCGACCRDLVPLAPLEARHVAAVVEALPEPRRSQVRQRFRDAVRRLEAAGLAEALRNLADPDSPDLRGGSVALDYFAQGIACPFLEDESCSIHAQRPIICREYLVVSPAELCALNRPEDVRAIRAPLGSLERAVPAVGPQTVGPRWIPLVLALEYVEANPEEPRQSLALSCSKNSSRSCRLRETPKSNAGLSARTCPFQVAGVILPPRYLPSLIPERKLMMPVSFRRFSASVAAFRSRFTVVLRLHPGLLAAGALFALATVAVLVQCVRAADSTPRGLVPLKAAAASTRLSDGRETTGQSRWDNLLFAPVPGWKKRNQEWSGQYTLEGPNFDKSRVQITGYFAVGAGDKGLAGLADANDKANQFYIDWKQEAPRSQGAHPAGYKTLTTFTSVQAKGYGHDARLYMLDVFLEANGIASRLHYAAAYRENFDQYKPAFDEFLKNVRLLSGVVLAEGFADQPPLEQFSINQCCDFVEWLLDVPLTDTQRQAARDHLTAAWKRHDKKEAAGFWEVFKARDELNKLKADKKELARVAARAEVIKNWREEAGKGDAMAKLMVEVYDRAQTPLAHGKPGEPPLTRQQSDATLEILHFMASKVAGFDVAPSDQQKADFAKNLSDKYAGMPLEAKKELEQMPLYWAWLRAAWPEVPAQEQRKLTEQWSAAEPIKPIITQVNDLKAKAIASGNYPGGYTDALRRLYHQQQTTAMISNMMTMQHRTNMMIINNIGSSNYRYEYRYVYRYR